MKKHKAITLDIANVLLGGECDGRAAAGIKALSRILCERFIDSTLYEHLCEQFLDNDATCDDKNEREAAYALRDFTEEKMEELLGLLQTLTKWIYDTDESKMSKGSSVLKVVEKSPNWFAEQFAESIREKFPELADELIGKTDEEDDDEEIPVERDEENTFTTKPAPAQIIVGPAFKGGFCTTDYITQAEANIPHVDTDLDQLRELIESRLNVSVNFFHHTSVRKKESATEATALPLPIFQIVIGRMREMPLTQRNAEYVLRRMVDCGVQLFVK